jgi:hypothetical protein
MHRCSEELSLWTYEGCTATKCSVNPAKNIQICLEQYINELSQQLFKKKNLRGDLSWWLPTFCSLVIQGFVLRTLKASSTTAEDLESKYLQTAVRLFLVVSPKDMNGTDEELGKILLSFGFKDPAECLRDVFGMLDEPAKSPRATNEPPTSGAIDTMLEIVELETFDQVSHPATFIPRQITQTNIDTTKDQLEDTQMIDGQDSAEDGHVSWLAQCGKRRLSPDDDDADEVAHVGTTEVLLLIEKSGEAIEIPNLSSKVSAPDEIFSQAHLPRENLEAYATLERDLERELKYGYSYGHANLDAAEAKNMLRARLSACRRPWW